MGEARRRRLGPSAPAASGLRQPSIQPAKTGWTGRLRALIHRLLAVRAGRL